MSDASFTVAPVLVGASILTSTTGTAYTPNLPGSSKRVVIIVSDEDASKLESLGRKPVVVTDLMTGIEHRVKSAACGVGCRCGAELMP